MSPLFFKRVSDEMLGSRLASGEAAAFDELYRRYANRLAAYGAHLLGDAGLGDDVAQATMLKAYGALREGRVPNKMKPWLFRIAHNVAIDLVVRRRELPSADLPEPLTGDREPYTGTLIAALATLPDRQRRAYVLREVHGLRIDETAAELGLTTGQVEQALFAARNRLAEQLVFGDRLNCVTVQRLASGPLDTEERRALKTHLRTCTACRQSLGVRGRALSVFPAGMSLEWLPRLGAGLLGGGAPAVAKVGAVVATATIAAGGTVAVETVRSHAHRPVIPRVAVKATPVADIEPGARVDAAVLRVARRPAVPVVVASHGRSGPTTDANDRLGKDAAEHRGGSSEPAHRGEHSGRRESGGSHTTRTHADGDHSSRSGTTSSGRRSGSGSGSGERRDGGGSGERHDGGGSGRDGGAVSTTSGGGDGRSGGSGTSGSGSDGGDGHSGRDGGAGGGTTTTATSGDGHHDGGEATTTTSRTGDGDHATTTTDSDRRDGDETRTTTTTTTTTTTMTTTTAPTTTTTTTTPDSSSGGGGGGTDGGGGGGGTDGSGGGGGGTDGGGSTGGGGTDGHGGDVADLQPVDSSAG